MSVPTKSDLLWRITVKITDYVGRKLGWDFRDIWEGYDECCWEIREVTEQFCEKIEFLCASSFDCEEPDIPPKQEKIWAVIWDYVDTDFISQENWQKAQREFRKVCAKIAKILKGEGK